MKICRLWPVYLAASLGVASAQISVEVTQEQNQFLQGESLPVAVRITNRSGQPLRLGAEKDWLTFSIETREGEVVPKLEEAPVSGEFVLESSKVAIKRLDLAPYFNFTHTGSYGIVATLKIPNWAQDVPSRPKYFDVIEGAKLWEQEVGVPQPAAAVNSIPEIRRYTLQQANYLKSQIRLYLRVSDTYGRTLRVFPIGPMVSFGRPEPQIDRHSNLHVLYQYGPGSFNYSVFDIDGFVIRRQTYDYVDSRPRLRINDDGEVSVTGGERRVTSTDVPAPETAATEPGPSSAVVQDPQAAARAALSNAMAAPKR